MTRRSAGEIALAHIEDGVVYDWAAAWEWSSFRHANARLEAPGAGALRQLIDLMVDLAPPNALDSVLTDLKRTGLVDVQPRLIPQIISKAQTRKRQRDCGLRPSREYRKMRFARINADVLASSAIAMFLIRQIDVNDVDEMEAVLEQYADNRGGPNSAVAHFRLYAALVNLARNAEKLEGLI